uniref:Uncharacterized protein n=1 Tax=Parascaris univalens TaxID=6257 RepID=A0A915ADI6_PARUN
MPLQYCQSVSHLLIMPPFKLLRKKCGITKIIRRREEESLVNSERLNNPTQRKQRESHRKHRKCKCTVVFSKEKKKRSEVAFTKKHAQGASMDEERPEESSEVRRCGNLDDGLVVSV